LLLEEKEVAEEIIHRAVRCGVRSLKLTPVFIGSGCLNHGGTKDPFGCIPKIPCPNPLSGGGGHKAEVQLDLLSPPLDLQPHHGAQGLIFHKVQQTVVALHGLAVDREDHVPQHPAPGRVEVSLCVVSREAVLQVKDSGIGITEADLPHVFDRFYRTDLSRSQVEGSGLGLAIAKWIAHTHGVDIKVFSDGRSGCTFSVSFLEVESGGYSLGSGSHNL